MNLAASNMSADDSSSSVGMDETPGKSARISFGGLSAIRGLAAMLVVVHHIELYNKRDSQSSLHETLLGPSLHVLGRHSVEVFFVLSGFLITYLLKHELETTRKIDLKRFWIRRTLRIWPLYFVVVVIAFVLLPLLAFEPAASGSHFGKLLTEQHGQRSTLVWYFVFFLPNLALSRGHVVPGVSQAWSIGVEEQFYFLWPLMISITKKHFWILCFIVIAKPAFCHFLHVSATMFPIEFMGWGALGALWFYRFQPAAKRILSIRWLRVAVSIVFLACWVTPVSASSNPLLTSIRGAVFIVGLLFVTSIFETRREPAVLKWLGKYSYGIYMLHPAWMFLMLTLLPVDRSESFRLSHMVRDYSLVGGATLVSAWLSYKYLEHPFLSVKEKFQVIESGS